MGLPSDYAKIQGQRDGYCFRYQKLFFREWNTIYEGFSSSLFFSVSQLLKRSLSLIRLYFLE